MTQAVQTWKLVNVNCSIVHTPNTCQLFHSELIVSWGLNQKKVARSCELWHRPKLPGFIISGFASKIISHRWQLTVVIVTDQLDQCFFHHCWSECQIVITQWVKRESVSWHLPVWPQSLSTLTHLPCTSNLPPASLPPPITYHTFNQA